MSDFSEKLRTGCRKLGLELDPEVLGRLGVHQALLTKWMRRINLTAISDPGDMADRLYLDCLMLGQHLDDGQTLHDVGSGAGFPGLVLKAMWPGMAVTLTEARHKRVSFLRQAAREMGLVAGLDIRWQRLGWEEGESDRSESSLWSEVVSRATFPPREWLRRGATLVRPGGRIWVMAGHAVEGEEDISWLEKSESRGLLTESGLIHLETIAYRLPASGVDRRLLVFCKK